MCNCRDGRLLLILLFLLNGTGLVFDSAPFAALFTERYTAYFKLFSEGAGLPMLSPGSIAAHSVVLVFLFESVLVLGATLTLAHQAKGLQILLGAMLLLAISAVVEGLWLEALRDLAVVGGLLLLDPQQSSQPLKKPPAPALLSKQSHRQKAE